MYFAVMLNDLLVNDERLNATCSALADPTRHSVEAVRGKGDSERDCLAV